VRKLLFIPILLILTACASFDARLKTAADIHAATTRSVTSALDAQLISSTDAEAYQEIAVNSSYILDSARALKDTDVQSAEAKLDLANKLLIELHKYLLEQEDK
jgi:hypothetical protein